MSSLQPVRGTHDLLPEEMRRYRRVVETARAVAERYGYLEMATPIFEFSDVFKRTLGDTSDIVTKEMYSFTDRGGEQLTLRPEGTASVARALISEGLAKHLPLKYFYSGPMFRYERPQKGRMRQFHQTGVELLGVAQPQGDVEIVAVGAAILRELGVLDRTVLEINTLGDSESRNAYRGVLVDYLQGHKARLSKESIDRLERNPLRILDSKDEGDQVIVANAPVYTDHLNVASRSFFDAVKQGLDATGIAYQINSRLVRGLDYYCHTCFEFTAAELGAQKTVMAGGRYDGLVEIMAAGTASTAIARSPAGWPGFCVPTAGCCWRSAPTRVIRCPPSSPPPVFAAPPATTIWRACRAVWYCNGILKTFNRQWERNRGRKKRLESAVIPFRVAAAERASEGPAPCGRPGCPPAVAAVR